MNMTAGIKLNDTNTGYTLQIRKAVLEFDKTFPSKFDVAIYTNTESLKKLIARPLTLDDAMKSGQVKVDGDPNNLKKFVSVLDTGLKPPGQATDADIG
jgi:alkyl sulfatase BDS1-like metallo-beta-lactamase superfamily hydrolase